MSTFQSFTQLFYNIISKHVSLNRIRNLGFFFSLHVHHQYSASISYIDEAKKDQSMATLIRDLVTGSGLIKWILPHNWGLVRDPTRWADNNRSQPNKFWTINGSMKFKHIQPYFNQKKKHTIIYILLSSLWHLRFDSC